MIAKFSPYLILILAFTVGFFSVAGNHGLLQLRELDNELEQLKSQNSRLENNVKTIEQKIVEFNESDQPLERLAREELGLSREGEVVYIFPK